MARHESAGKLCVIFNPTAGRRRARRRLDAIRSSWRNQAEFWPTRHAGHARELAAKAADDGFEIVAAAGGDGTVHEVANGLLRSGREDVVFAVVPLGSANDYAYSLTRRGIGATPRRVDVGHLQIGDGQDCFFLCCLGIGFNGRVTALAKQIGHLQGVMLYGLAALQAMWSDWRFPEVTLQWDGQAPVTEPLLMVSLMIGHREGGFLLAPQAELDDGWFDTVVARSLSRWRALSLIPRLALSGPPRNDPRLLLSRSRKLVLTSADRLAAHVDGEVVTSDANPADDGIREAHVELLPRRLLVRLGLD